MRQRMMHKGWRPWVASVGAQRGGAIFIKHRGVHVARRTHLTDPLDPEREVRAYCAASAFV